MLMQNSVGPAVVELKRLLADQGFWTGSMSPIFGKQLDAAVAYFQQTHLGPDKQPLDVDGIVGPDTLWALKHATGKAQKEGLGPNLDTRIANIPKSLAPGRQLVLAVALRQHGIREQPNGSNRGPGVDKFIPDWARTTPGPAWCCFFVCWVLHCYFKVHILGRHHGSCATAWRAAEKRGMALPGTISGIERELALPMPGDVFYMDYGNGKGHFGFIYRVAEDYSRINTIEGNCGNRVKIGCRTYEENEQIRGIINPWPEDTRHQDYELGLIKAGDVGKEGTR